MLLHNITLSVECMVRGESLMQVMMALKRKMQNTLHRIIYRYLSFRLHPVWLSLDPSTSTNDPVLFLLMAK